MDQQYKRFHQEARGLRHKLQDFLDDHAHPMAQTLKREVQRLEDEFEMNKKPRSLEDRIKFIQDQLRRADEAVMDLRHADFLHDRFEDMKLSLRRLPNY